MDDRNRRLVGLNDTIDYSRHRSETTIATNPYHLQQQQQQQHLMMLPQPPPLLIHTVPSYASNRSVSNQSVSNHSISNRSVATSATRGQAELIAVATNQARAAARSILLTGGSQAAALSTAKAAATSALIPAKQASGDKPPIGSTRNNNFRNRRKNRQQAEIIASMALVSANEALEFGAMGNNMMTITPGGLHSVYNSERSEFPDDYTSYRSLGPGSIHGRSHSGHSYKELQQSQHADYYEQSRQDIPSKQTIKALELPAKGIQGQSTIDQSTFDYKVIKNNHSLRSNKSLLSHMVITKNPSLKNLAQEKQAPAEIIEHNNTLPETTETVPKSKIPTEMPMPKSSSMKGTAFLKKSSSGKQNAKIMDRNATPRSREQFNESQISCYSGDHSTDSRTNSYSYAGSTYDEHTADYTRGTFESAVDSTARRKSTFANRGNRFSSGASFFSTMDPFVRTFSEVFSCNPGVPCQSVPQSNLQSDINRHVNQHETRDAAVITPYNNIIFKEDVRDQPPSRQPMIDASRAAPRRSISIEESILSATDIHSTHDNAETKRQQELSTSKTKAITSPTMEQLVLRALSAISPKGSGSKRPKLNLKPLKQSVGPFVATATSYKSTKYRSFNDDSGNNSLRMNGSANTSKKEAVIDTAKTPILSRNSKKANKNGSFSYNSGSNPSMESYSSGMHHPQPKQPSGSSSSGDYYVSNNSTDDSGNKQQATADVQLQPSQTTATMRIQKVVAADVPNRTSNTKNRTERSGKRFSSFFTKRTVRDETE